MKNTYRKIIIIPIALLLMAYVSVNSLATTYYVSNNGNDSNSGLSESLPWKTLAKVNTIVYLAGDQILFQCGSTFYGTLAIKYSGTSGNPIIYGSYGSGSNPVITGFTAVTAWTNQGNNIWQSTSSVSSLTHCHMLTVNGINTPMGRYPAANTSNGGYLTFQSSTGTTNITSSSLTGTPGYVGYEAVIRITNYQLARTIITSQSGSTINFKAVGSTPASGNGFFIQGGPLCLINQNDWYFNGSTGILQMYSKNEPTNVNIASADSLVALGNSNKFITFQNLSFTGANGCAIWLNSSQAYCSNITVNKCSFNNIGQSAIYGCGYYLNYTNNTITNSNGNALSPNYGTNFTITGNTIINSGVFQGMQSCNTSWTNCYNLTAPCINLENVTTYNISNNYIQNTGYTAIGFYGANGTVQNNVVDTFCRILDDGGGIYTYTGNQTLETGYIINGNIVLNGMPVKMYGDAGVLGVAGIYLDNNSGNVTVENNTVANTYRIGILLNDDDGPVTVENNTCYNNAVGQLWINYKSGVQTYNFNIDNNIFIAAAPCTSGQFTGYFNSPANNISLDTYNNNYYACPISQTKVIYAYQPSIGTQNYTLMQWQSFSGQDGNSKGSPEALQSASDMNLYYNTASSPTVTYLANPMIDVKGTVYMDSIVLQPFTSIVLMKDYNPPKYSKVIKTICNGSSYDGFTASGTYNQTYTAESGEDSTVIIYLTVNPAYSINDSITINSGQSYMGWSTSGTYSRYLMTFSGCDSTVTTKLFVNVDTTVNKSICQGSYYNGWTTTGKYVQNFASTAGADSIVTTYLTVNPTYSIFENITLNEDTEYFGYKAPATFIRTLISYLGCDSIVTTQLLVSESTAILNVNINGNNMVDIYPNPSKGVFTVRFSTLPAEGSYVEIYDFSGKEVVSRLITENYEEFNLSGNASGLYLIKSIFGNQEKINKLIIQK